MPLPLQPLFNSVYEDGRYDRTVDHLLPPDPPLEAEDTALADTLLRERRHA